MLIVHTNIYIIPNLIHGTFYEIHRQHQQQQQQHHHRRYSLYQIGMHSFFFVGFVYSSLGFIFVGANKKNVENLFYVRIC